MQLIRSEWVSKGCLRVSVAQRRIAPAASPERPWDGAEQEDVVGKLYSLLESWLSAVEDDVEYQEAYKAVKEKRS